MSNTVLYTYSQSTKSTKLFGMVSHLYTHMHLLLAIRQFSESPCIICDLDHLWS